MKKIVCKLGNMRKAVDWVVYPRKDKSDPVVIQSDKRIATFDPETSRGFLSKSVSSGAYFLHLSPGMGAKPVVVSEDVRRMAERHRREDSDGPQEGEGAQHLHEKVLEREIDLAREMGVPEEDLAH